MNSQEMFSNAWNNCATEIPYDQSWENGTGYMDNACNVNLDKYQCVKSTDRFGRRILLKNLPEYGTQVIFERFKPNDEKRSSVIVGNLTDEVRKLGWPNSSWSADSIYDLITIGEHTVNFKRPDGK